MRQALDLARVAGAAGEVPVGAVMVREPNRRLWAQLPGYDSRPDSAC